MNRQNGRVGLMAAALVGLLASGAAADVTTEQSASILVFPKVIADGTRDTIIQITNTSNSMVHAHCFYVNAAPVLRDEPPGPGNPPQWQEIDFDIRLTKQQPTHWVVSLGRLVDLSDPRCSVIGHRLQRRRLRSGPRAAAGGGLPRRAQVRRGRLLGRAAGRQSPQGRGDARWRSSVA